MIRPAAFALAALLAWSLAAPGRALEALPPGAEALGLRLAQAEAAWKLARSRCDALEAAILPEAEELRALRAEPAAGFWPSWKLRRRLSRLQGSLAELAGRRQALEHAKSELFAVLSAVQEEIRAALMAGLKRGKGDPLELRLWLDAKGDFDRKLEEIGVSEERPFRLVGDPGPAPGSLRAKDRRKALEARGIQLEAWAEMNRQDLALIRLLGRAGILSRQEAERRGVELKSLQERISRLQRDAEGALSKI